MLDGINQATPALSIPNSADLAAGEWAGADLTGAKLDGADLARADL